ncbi:MAG: energy transducer TonB [Terrimicrobiaceae bacterium]
MSAGTRLIFDWPGRHNLQLVLPLTIILAVAVHLGIFFVFSIVYPGNVGEGPNQATVYFPLSGSADAERLQALLAIADPAIFAPGRGSADADTPAVTYLPSYAGTEVPPEPLPTRQLPSPSFREPLGAVEIPKPQPMHPTPQPASGTRLVVSQSLAGRAYELPAGAAFVTSGRLPAESARFLVSVNPDGAIANIFLQSSSGNPDLDESAARQLARMSFRPAGGETVWGDIFFVWGDDVQGIREP